MRLVAVLIAALLSIGGVAEAQTSASGRGFGATLDLLGTNLIDQSDTGTATAPSASNTPNPSAFDKKADEATVSLAPIAEVITGPSRTRGCVAAGGCPNLFPTPAPSSGALDTSLAAQQFVKSDGGTAVASVLLNGAAGTGGLPGGTDLLSGLGSSGSGGLLGGSSTSGTSLLDAVSNGSTAQVSCNADGSISTTADSGIDALTLNGSNVALPLNLSPNTTILTSSLPRLVLNEQVCPDPAAPAGTTTCSVSALHAQVASPLLAGILDLKLSGATASLTNANCTGGGGNGCNPILTNSIKTAQILQANRVTPKTPQVPAVGDPIRYTVAATNSTVANESCAAGAQTGHNLRIVDRIPIGVTVDPASITIQTDNGAAVPTTGTIAACPAGLVFTGCPGESDSGRQCLTVSGGDLPPSQTKRISFIATVSPTATGGSTVGCDSNGNGAGICNTALIQIDEIQNPSGTPRTAAIQCPIPGNGGDAVRTSGSGGCALGFDSRGRSEAVPMLLVAAWLLIRRWRRDGAHA